MQSTVMNKTIDKKSIHTENIARKKKIQKIKKTSSKIGLTAILAFVAVIMVMPVVWMVSASFKFESDVFNYPIEWIPLRPTFENYIKAFTDFPYLRWYLNTTKTTLIIVIATLIIASMSGYAFAKLQFKGKNVIFFMFISTLMVPIEVRLIPQFMLYQKLHLINTHWSVVLPWCLFNAFAIFYMRQAFMSLPNELIEAAKLDGCSEWGIFIRIAFPLAKSALIALGILAFTWGWNDYMSPLVYISDQNQQLLSVGIASFKSQYANNYALQMAGATVALIPVILVYLIAQKYFIEGIAQSGIKG